MQRKLSKDIPQTVTYRGQRYTLATDMGPISEEEIAAGEDVQTLKELEPKWEEVQQSTDEESNGDELFEFESYVEGEGGIHTGKTIKDLEDSGENIPQKKGRKPKAKLERNLCDGGGISFVIDLLVDSAKDPFPKKKGERRSVVSSKRLNGIDEIPDSVMDRFNAAGSKEEQKAVMVRIQDILEKSSKGKKGSPGLYLVRARGGWDWNDNRKKTQFEEVKEIQEVLNFMAQSKNIVFAYCNNNMVREDGDRGII